MAFPWSLSIDFGTSNTAAAHTNPVSGQVEVASLQHDRLTIGSHVYIEPSGEAVIGDRAWNLAEADPAGLVRTPKRQIVDGTVRVRGDEISVAKVISAVLTGVISKVSEAHDGEKPNEVIVTHPERWSSREIQVLREAVSLSGIPNESIATMSEAEAAAYYYTKANRLIVGDRIAVFDFGGGTLDVAVLRLVAPGGFKVEAHDGDPALGGRSFDNAVREWVFKQLEDDDPDLLDYLRADASEAELLDLSRQIEKAKELLSDSSSAIINIQTRRGTHPIQITRDEFAKIIAPYVERAVALAKQVLYNARVLSASDLQALYLTGGSSRVPQVQEALKELGTVRLDNPKTVVSLGALEHLLVAQEGQGGSVKTAVNTGPSNLPENNGGTAFAPTSSEPVPNGEVSASQANPEATVTSGDMATQQQPKTAVSSSAKTKAVKSGNVLLRSVVGALAIIGLLVILALGVSCFRFNSGTGQTGTVTPTQTAPVSTYSSPTPTAVKSTSASTAAQETSYAIPTLTATSAPTEMTQLLDTKIQQYANNEICGSVVEQDKKPVENALRCDLSTVLPQDIKAAAGQHILNDVFYDPKTAESNFKEVTSNLMRSDEKVIERYVGNDGACAYEKTFVAETNSYGVNQSCPNAGSIKVLTGFSSRDDLDKYADWVNQ